VTPASICLLSAVMTSGAGVTVSVPAT
jgi:hypothetical protein